MNITAEKEELVKRIYAEQDISVIYAVKNLLDDALNTPQANDEALEQELDLAIKEANNGELLPYDEVLKEFSTVHENRNAIN